MPSYGPCHEKTCLRGFRWSDIQTQLLSYRDKLENHNFTRSKSRYNAFQKVNNKGADQTARMCSLVSAFIVRKPPRFSRIWAHMINRFTLYIPLISSQVSAATSIAWCIHIVKTVQILIRDGFIISISREKQRNQNMRFWQLLHKWAAKPVQSKVSCSKTQFSGSTRDSN